MIKWTSTYQKQALQGTHSFGHASDESSRERRTMPSTSVKAKLWPRRAWWYEANLGGTKALR